MAKTRKIAYTKAPVQEFEYEPVPVKKGDIFARARDLYVIYQSKGKNEVIALKGVSFDIKVGEFLGIVGPSGSGKTSLLNCIGGMMKPTAGRMNYYGYDITRFEEKELVDFRRKTIGFVFQEGNLLPHLSAMGNILLTLKFCEYEKSKKKRALELLERVGLVQRKDYKASKLSSGELQRVAIARALANNPALILADEPTGNLDAETSVQILEIFKELNREDGTTLLVVTHDPITASYANNSVELRDGKITGFHEGDLVLEDLSETRLIPLDLENRLTLPDNILAEFQGESLKFWNIAVREVESIKSIVISPAERKAKEPSQIVEKTCPNCGETLPDRTRGHFCTSCGAKFNDIVK
ncbi:MAG: ATP-binding cassette domain-containing protein [Candidatus Hodarchaeales archaeon]|jgi:putative ABC transport system ATP-binding protein